MSTLLYKIEHIISLLNQVFAQRAWSSRLFSIDRVVSLCELVETKSKMNLMIVLSFPCLISSCLLSGQEVICETISPSPMPYVSSLRYGVAKSLFLRGPFHSLSCEKMETFDIVTLDLGDDSVSTSCSLLSCNLTVLPECISNGTLEKWLIHIFLYECKDKMD